MRPLLFTLNAAATLANSLCVELGAEAGLCTRRRFPDGESYLRIDSPVAQRRVILLCGLEHPDQQLLSALFFADTARELGADSVGLVTPYLPYMRQDIRFQPGEAVTSRSFATLLSRAFDSIKIKFSQRWRRSHKCGGKAHEAQQFAPSHILASELRSAIFAANRLMPAVCVTIRLMVPPTKLIPLNRRLLT